MHKICVYLSANDTEDSHLRQSVKQLAKLLVANNKHVIYGGSTNGLMGVFANEVLAHQGIITGIISKDLQHQECTHEGLTELITTETIVERKEKMLEVSDGFIVLPGGVGTLEELFTTWCAIKIGRYSKPINLLNLNGYYEPLYQQITHMGTNGFINEQHAFQLKTYDDIETLITSIP